MKNFETYKEFEKDSLVCLKSKIIDNKLFVTLRKTEKKDDSSINRKILLFE